MKNTFLSIKLLKKIIGYTFIAFLLISFHELIEELVLISLVEPLLSQFVGGNEIVFRLFLILVVLLFIYFIYLIIKDYRIPKHTSIAVVLVALIYSYYRYAEGSAFEFTPIPILNEKLFYLDIT